MTSLDRLIMELAPVPGLYASDYAAARLVYHIMGLVERNAVLPGAFRRV